MSKVTQLENEEVRIQTQVFLTLKLMLRTSLAVQWLTLPFNAGGAGSIPGWGAKIPHALRPKNQNVKQKQYGNKLNKDF